MNNRVCPYPDWWVKFYEILPTIIEDDKKTITAPSPLILGGWWDNSDQRKIKQLEKQIIFAHNYNAFFEVNDFLRNLNDDQWYHRKIEN